jgi:hypothetical protein
MFDSLVPIDDGHLMHYIPLRPLKNAMDLEEC